jgi:hypothetical protein
MPIIEQTITTNDFELGGIMVETGEFTDNNARMRSIDIIPLQGHKTFSVEAKDSSGNPLYFSFVAYGYSDEFISYEGVIDTAWNASGTTIDLSKLNIAGIRITLKFDNDVTLADLGECNITFSTNAYFTISDSYPYLIGEDELIELPSEPYPYIMMIQNEGEYPKYARLELTDIPIEPTPYSVMVQNEGEYPRYTRLELTDIPIEPTPYSVMVQNEGEYPRYTRLEPIKMGAFIDAYELKHINIPPSVKSIGEFTFKNTQLASVTIAKDCEYYPTSFPDDCEINFYE